jgi:hypothetical protein
MRVKLRQPPADGARLDRADMTTVRCRKALEKRRQIAGKRPHSSSGNRSSGGRREDGVRGGVIGSLGTLVDAIARPASPLYLDFLRQETDDLPPSLISATSAAHVQHLRTSGRPARKASISFSRLPRPG